MGFITRRKIAAAAGIGTIGAAGIVAYAAWSAAGTGSGSAKALTAQTITATAASGTADLYPGGPAGTVYFTLSNPNPYAVTMTGVSYGTITSSDPINCSATNASIDAGAPSTVSFPLSAHASGVSDSIPGVLALAHAAPDGCQGVSFTVALTLSGAQD
jgi:hypothetical protein